MADLRSGRRVRLRDGSSAIVRPIEPADKERLAEGLRQLSSRARYLRFHAPVEALTEEQLRYLTEVDGRDHVAWVALDPESPDESGMGVARYVRLRDEPHVAEAAVTVLDRYQGKGVGTLLLGLLARSAVDNDVRVLRNYVLADNEGMLALLDELGATRTDDGTGVYRIDIPLPEDEEHLPGVLASDMLRASAGRRLRFLDALRRRLPAPTH